MSGKTTLKPLRNRLAMSKSGDELDLDTARSKATAYEYLCHLEATKRCASVHVLVCAPHPSVMTG